MEKNLRLCWLTKGAMEMRKEIYEELIALGYTPDEAWEQISQMEFAEDYED